MDKKYIYALVESYFDSTEQMNKILKDVKVAQRAEENAKAARLEFITSVLGKNTFNKLDNKGLFAPVPLNALHLTRKDFDDLNTDIDSNKTDRLILYISAAYYKNEFKVFDDGSTEGVIKTNINFRTIDEIVDFFLTVLKMFKRVYKTEDVNWKPLVRKFRAYMK